MNSVAENMKTKLPTGNKLDTFLQNIVIEIQGVRHSDRISIKKGEQIK